MKYFIKYIKENDYTLVVLFVILVGSYIYFSNIYRKKSLNSEVNYAIGTIVSHRIGARVPNWFVFEFYVDNKVYSGRYDIVGNSKIDSIKKKEYYGRKYLVKYSVGKVKYNEMYLNKPLPENFKDCVKCNWKEPPF